PSGTFSQLYMAVSKDDCQSFTDHTVFDGESKFGENKVQFGDIFNDLAIDGAGNLYVIGDGFVNTPSDTATTWFLKSTDGGQHWSDPAQLDSPHAAYMLPAAIGGPQAGQLAIGYFRTTNGVTDPNSDGGVWTYATAESTNANSASPTFSYSDVNPGYVYHTGQICNEGILCGLPGQPSDRSLVDFTSATLDPHGCPLFVFAGNTPQSEANNQTWNFVARQTSGCFSSTSAGSSTTSGPGGSTQPGGSQHKPPAHHRAKHKRHAKKHKRHARRHRRHRKNPKKHARHHAALDFVG
ncbi:MAG TPA: hypothetical protein VKJ07_18365, partial [Mycobacteriales bacterium]|nr:hypothetical protein [Mycobacteriales bacterium]